MKQKVSFLFLFLSFHLFAQNYILGGVILDENDKPLDGVNIFLKNNPKKGVSTSDDGYFEINLPQGKHLIIVSYLGYQQKEFPVDLKKNKYIIIHLNPAIDKLNEIVIKVKETNKKELIKYIGVTKLNIKKIEKIPMLLGERDVLKAIQILPGVKTTSEGSAGFSVHGGSTDQNLILLDGAPVYHPSHLLGFFSVFTPDIIRDLKLFKSSIPASYGNRLSSILDVNTRIGNKNDFHIGGGIGLIAAQAYVEGPIRKEKSSYLFSARRTYADLYVPFLNIEDIKDAKTNFYDLNLKLDFDLNKKSNLQINAYTGRDIYEPYPTFLMNYGNSVGSIHFTHRFNNKLTGKTSAIFSQYDYEISLEENIDHQDYVFDISMAIQNNNFKQNFDYKINEKNKLNFGIDVYYHTIKPGDLKNNIKGQEHYEYPDRHAAEFDIYAQHLTKLGKNIRFSYGLRASIFSRLGKETFYKYNELGETTDTLYAGKYESVKTFYKFAPRLALNWRLHKNTSIKLSYDKTYQFLHYLINDATTTPTDLWLPSGINLKPQSSDQYSIEYNQAIGKKYFLSIGGYYRDIQDITDYKIGTTLSLSPYIESDLTQGKGRAYGLEFLLKKSTGKFTGSLAYTYSKTEKIFNEINEGKWYPAAEDRPHDLSILGSYQLSDRVKISTMFTYYSGRPITLPAGTYLIDTHVVLFFSHRNANRLPDYQRLDVSFTWENKKYKQIGGKKIKKKFESYWNFSIYNVYAYDNTFMLKFKYDEETETIDAYKVTLFKFVPSISYHFKF
jgi:hypothetical protein